MKPFYELEIYEQPKDLARLLENKSQDVARIAAELQSRSIRFVVVAARGTSDNAARYAKYMLGAFKRVPVALAMPSLYTLYDQPLDLRDGLVIGISQSGQATDVIAVLEEAKRQGAPTLAITNYATSPMAQMADYAINLDVGEEKSVAASKTYTAQMTAVAMLAAHWSKVEALQADLLKLPELAQTVLSQDSVISEIAKRFAKDDRLVTVGRGYNYCTALEIGLKIKELSYMAAQAYSSADFRHGPIALLEPGFPVFAIAPQGKTIEDMRELVEVAQGIQADVTVFTNDPVLAEKSPSLVRLPDGLPEWLSPIVGVIPGQLLALRLAQSKGYDVDHPRGLRKVTLTY